MRPASRPSKPARPVSTSSDSPAGVTISVDCPPSTSTARCRACYVYGDDEHRRQAERQRGRTDDATQRFSHELTARPCRTAPASGGAPRRRLNEPCLGHDQAHHHPHQASETTSPLCASGTPTPRTRCGAAAMTRGRDWRPRHIVLINRHDETGLSPPAPVAESTPANLPPQGRGSRRDRPQR
jgi:hypothetical protein